MGSLFGIKLNLPKIPAPKLSSLVSPITKLTDQVLGKDNPFSQATQFVGNQADSLAKGLFSGNPSALVRSATSVVTSTLGATVALAQGQDIVLTEKMKKKIAALKAEQTVNGVLAAVDEVLVASRDLGLIKFTRTGKVYDISFLKCSTESKELIAYLDNIVSVCATYGITIKAEASVCATSTASPSNQGNLMEFINGNTQGIPHSILLGGGLLLLLRK